MQQSAYSSRHVFVASALRNRLVRRIPNQKERFMGLNKVIFATVLCSGVFALGACGMFDRDGDSGRARSTPSSTSGQSSAQTTQVQQALKAKGYDPGTINGVMGSQTQEALRRFQKENGLPATGTVDAQTAKALGLSSSASGTTSPSGDRSGGSSGSSPGASGPSSGGSAPRDSQSGSSGSGSSRSGSGY